VRALWGMCPPILCVVRAGEGAHKAKHWRWQVGSRLGAPLVQFCDGSLWYSVPHSQLFSSRGNEAGEGERERTKKRGGGPVLAINT